MGGAIGGHIGASGGHYSSRMGHQQLQVTRQLLQTHNNNKSPHACCGLPLRPNIKLAEVSSAGRTPTAYLASTGGDQMAITSRNCGSKSGKAIWLPQSGGCTVSFNYSQESWKTQRH